MSDELIDQLKNGRIDTALFCELATYKGFVKLLADIKEAHRGRAESTPKKSVAAELKKDLEEVANFKGSRLE